MMLLVIILLSVAALGGWCIGFWAGWYYRARYICKHYRVLPK